MKVHELISKLSEYDMNMEVGYLDHDYFNFYGYTEAETREEDVWEKSILPNGAEGPSVGTKREVLVLW